MLGASLTSARIEMGRDQLARRSIRAKYTGEAPVDDGLRLVKRTFCYLHYSQPQVAR